MPVLRYNRKTDWPKLGPSLLIATALVVAIRTAKWAAKGPRDAALADVDHELDAEVAYAVRIIMRVFTALVSKHENLFPQVSEPISDYSDEDVPD